MKKLKAEDIFMLVVPSSLSLDGRDVSGDR